LEKIGPLLFADKNFLNCALVPGIGWGLKKAAGCLLFFRCMGKSE
jgi:hypothetical protein